MDEKLGKNYETFVFISGLFGAGVSDLKSFKLWKWFVAKAKA